MIRSVSKYEEVAETEHNCKMVSLLCRLKSSLKGPNSPLLSIPWVFGSLLSKSRSLSQTIA